MSDQHQFTLRDQMTYEKGNRLVVGPEVLTMSLDEAYAIKHKLEEVGEIEKAWKSKRADHIRAKRKNALINAYLRAGVTEQEARMKAEMVVSGKKPKPEKPFRAPKEDKPKSTGGRGGRGGRGGGASAGTANQANNNGDQGGNQGGGDDGGGGASAD